MARRVLLPLALLLVLLSPLAVAREGKDGRDGSRPKQSTVHPTNEYCPVMEGKEVDPDIWVDYRGKRIWFCCTDCRDSFEADPETYLADLPQFQKHDAATRAGSNWGDSGPAGPDAREEHPLGPLHPMLVHFPIALTMVALLAALLGVVFSGEFLKSARTWCMVLAALFVIPTFFLGDQAAQAKGKMSSSLARSVHEHEEWGETALWVLLGGGALELAYASLRTRNRVARGLIDRMEKAPEKSLRKRAAGILESGETVLVLEWLSFAGILVAAVVVGITGYHGAQVTHGAHHLDPLLHLLGVK